MDKTIETLYDNNLFTILVKCQIRLSQFKKKASADLFV